MKEEKLTARTIKELRHKTNLSQTQFANHFNIPVGTLHNWEQSIYAPPEYVIAMLQRLCMIDFDIE